MCTGGLGRRSKLVRRMTNHRSSDGTGRELLDLVVRRLLPGVLSERVTTSRTYCAKRSKRERSQGKLETRKDEFRFARKKRESQRTHFLLTCMSCAFIASKAGRTDVLFR